MSQIIVHTRKDPSLIARCPRITSTTILLAATGLLFVGCTSEIDGQGVTLNAFVTPDNEQLIVQDLALELADDEEAFVRIGDERLAIGIERDIVVFDDGVERPVEIAAAALDESWLAKLSSATTTVVVEATSSSGDRVVADLALESASPEAASPDETSGISSEALEYCPGGRSVYFTTQSRFRGQNYTTHKYGCSFRAINCGRRGCWAPYHYTCVRCNR